MKLGVTCDANLDLLYLLALMLRCKINQKTTNACWSNQKTCHYFKQEKHFNTNCTTFPDDLQMNLNSEQFVSVGVCARRSQFAFISLGNKDAHRPLCLQSVGRESQELFKSSSAYRCVKQQRSKSLHLVLVCEHGCSRKKTEKKRKKPWPQCTNRSLGHRSHIEIETFCTLFGLITVNISIYIFVLYYAQQYNI